jgi:MFS family permease
MDHPASKEHLRYNITVNLMDGGFFGFALGFASFFTIIPLFVSTLTDSPILIGLIPAIHAVGWQLPQLFTANRISRLGRIKPMVMWMTTQERLPFLGLAIVAWLLPSLSRSSALTITYLLLIWQGLGAGFAANPWQNMIVKIIPSDLRGTFLGGQAATANLLASLSAVLAGLILVKLTHPMNYSLCFLLASLGMGLSLICLGMTREPESAHFPSLDVNRSFWKEILSILKTQPDFRKFILVRTLLAFATLAFAFYTVYAVRFHHVDEVTIGLMTGVYMGTQIIANPVMGWLGDRFGHHAILEGGVIACIFSAFVAWWATQPYWFYLVFILAGIGNVAVWTTGLAMTLEFGSDAERPAYIGLVNSLVAPSTILAPVLGGWLASWAGYPTTFGLSIVCGVLTFIFLLAMRKTS